MKSQFIYLSACCSAEATKPPCVKVAKAVTKKKGKGKRGEEREKAPEFSSLGHWSCSQCGKSCKVRRENRPEEPKKETA